MSTKKYGWTKDVLINKIEAKTYENYLGQSNFDMTLPEKIRTRPYLPERRIYIRPRAFRKNIPNTNWNKDYKEYPRVPSWIARYSVFLTESEYRNVIIAQGGRLFVNPLLAVESSY